MTLSAHEKRDLAHYRMEKAQACLKDARTLLDTGSMDSSVNRSYYAILNATRALLALRGFDARTHEGAKTLLSREYIRTGLLPRQLGEAFRSVQARRMDSDYGDYLDIGQSEAEDSLESAQTFVDAVRKVMSELEKE